MLFSVSMFPIGAGRSVLHPVSEVVDEIDKAGLPYEVNGMSTVIEGDLDAVLPVLARAERRLRAEHERVFTVLTIDDNADATDRLATSPREVEQELGRAIAR
jgi:uncharacterized protein (TIGR00106 family)